MKPKLDTPNSTFDPIYRLFDLRKSNEHVNIWENNLKSILLIEYKDYQTLDLKEAKIVVQEVLPFVQGGIQFAISDLRLDNYEVTEEAKIYLADNAALASIKWNAVILSNLPIRMNVQHFIKKHLPIKPFESFNNIEDAMTWFKYIKA